MATNLLSKNMALGLRAKRKVFGHLRNTSIIRILDLYPINVNWTFACLLFVFSLSGLVQVLIH